MEKLINIIESLLFLSGKGIKKADIQEKLNVSAKELNKALDSLKEKYSDDCGIQLIVFADKVQFSSNPEYADSVAEILNPIKEKELTNAVLETLAIIAFKQPVTRMEIEEIRGGSADYCVQMLLKLNLIEVVGRKDAIGKPLLFGTTEEFLKRFQLESLDDLPDNKHLLERLPVIETGEPETTSLYGSTEIIPVEKEEIPEFLQGENLNVYETQGGAVTEKPFVPEQEADNPNAENSDSENLKEFLNADPQGKIA